MPMPCRSSTVSGPGGPGKSQSAIDLPPGNRNVSWRAISASDSIASLLREEVAVYAEQRLTLRLGQTRIGLDRPLGVDGAGFVRRRCC
jgi:hypothetical protein